MVTVPKWLRTTGFIYYGRNLTPGGTSLAVNWIQIPFAARGMLCIKYLTPNCCPSTARPAIRLMKFRREKSISKSWSATISWCQECGIKAGADDRHAKGFTKVEHWWQKKSILNKFLIPCRSIIFHKIFPIKTIKTKNKSDWR